MDVLYSQINDGLEYNLPYVHSDFTCNPGPTKDFSFFYYCRLLLSNSILNCAAACG